MLDHKGPPPVISGFTYLERLGAGGYSTVYLFEQHMPRREVAVKVMNADVEDKTASRFESEANLMARVSSHPAILSIYGAGVSADGHPFLVMEYCPPPQLGAILRQGPLNVAETLSTAIQIAGAVETAHRAGIVHRDIKPANILFTTYRRPVLSDFGISAMSGPEGTEELRGMSVPWAPPEQLVGMRSANPASDIYSLGATTFAMLTGRSPFETDGIPDVYELSRRIVKDPLPPLGRQAAGGSFAAAGTPEMLITLVTDAALAAQNAVVAAESLGLGTCFTGGIRLIAPELTEWLGLPAYTYPLFGLCIGKPAVEMQVKPRLPQQAAVAENRYPSDEVLSAALADYEATMTAFGEKREKFPFREKFARYYSQEYAPRNTKLLRDQGLLRQPEGSDETLKGQNA